MLEMYKCKNSIAHQLNSKFYLLNEYHDQQYDQASAADTVSKPCQNITFMGQISGQASTIIGEGVICLTGPLVQFTTLWRLRLEFSLLLVSK